eukprot:TRINITY_DN3384_c0_g2_i1.p1 TRINITY_DN3384_c0_g2~~TRINITY_DN3384_c0_g2_i1.p1  ORF type:complete len:329 (+),score=74.64 TRINITY_DN3384_c0_g2_i1:67-987(+)
MCDPCVLWGLAVGANPSLCARAPEVKLCNRLLLCVRNLPEQAPRQQQTCAPPQQEKLQASGRPGDATAEDVLGAARPLKLRSSRGGLRARPHAFRLSPMHDIDDAPAADSLLAGSGAVALRASSMPPTKASSSKDVSAPSGGFLCISASSSRSASPSKEAGGGLAAAPLLPVDAQSEAAPPKGRRKNASRRHRCRSSGKRALLHRMRRRLRSQSGKATEDAGEASGEEEEEEEEHDLAAEAAAMAVGQVMAAQGYAYSAGSWDWPLSRLEKKARLLMLDRQVLIADRDEIAEELAHLRRHSFGQHC